jgi:hypothetical protein
MNIGSIDKNSDQIDDKSACLTRTPLSDDVAREMKEKDGHISVFLSVV